MYGAPINAYTPCALFLCGDLRRGHLKLIRDGFLLFDYVHGKITTQLKSIYVYNTLPMLYIITECINELCRDAQDSWVLGTQKSWVFCGFGFQVLGGYFSLGKMEFWRKILQKFAKSIMKFEIWLIYLFMMNIPIFRNFC